MSRRALPATIAVLLAAVAIVTRPAIDRIDAAATTHAGLSEDFVIRSNAFLPCVVAVSRPVEATGQWACLDDGSPDPCNSDLYDVVFSEDGIGWAVGDNGVVLRHAHGRWTRSQAPAEHDLRAVEVVSQDDVWAVGESGAIVHWDGIGWQSHASPTDGHILDVDVVSPADGWAIGRQGHTADEYFDDGLMLHWDGTSWSEVDLPDHIGPLYRIVLPAPDDGWAVGSAVLRWDGKRWTQWDVRKSARIRAIDCLSPTECWMAAPGTLWHWQGADWVPEDGPEGSMLTDLVARPSDWPLLLFEAEVGLMVDGVWTRLARTPVDVGTQHALDLVGSTDGWSVGVRGSVMRLTADNWEPRLPLNRPHLRALHFLDSDNGYGYRYGLHANELWHWDGTRWAYLSEAPDLHGAHMLDAEHGWGVGDNVIAQWDGDRWQAYEELEDRALRDVDLLSWQDGWAVGSKPHRVSPWQPADWGAVFRWDGVTWTEADVQIPVRLQDVEMVTSDNVWAVGGEIWLNSQRNPSCHIVHWDGASWSNVPCPAKYSLSSIDMVSATDGWAVGGIRDDHRNVHACVIVRWDGESWLQWPCPNDSSLASVAMLSTDDGWAVGCDGTILHWDGRDWTLQTKPVDHTLFQIVFASPTQAWIAGQYATLLRRAMP